MTNLIAQIKERRIAQGISQTRLAEMTGIAQPNIARFESGKHPISVNTLERILNALQCTITLKDI